MVRRISRNGRYVGTFADPTSGRPKAWTSIGLEGALTLPVPTGYVSSTAIDVNGCGTILGTGIDAAGHQHALLRYRVLTCDRGPMLASAR
jgi:hypothetical protein